MKARALLLVLALACAVFAAEDSVKLTKTFKQGDKDTYQLHATMNASGGEADLDQTTVDTITKVTDSGEADATVDTTDFHVTAGGTDIPVAAPPQRTFHFDKHGIPVGLTGEDARQSRLAMFDYTGMLFDQDMKAGQPLTLNWTDPKDAKSKISGTATLDSITGGIAHIRAKYTVDFGDGTPPMKADLDEYFNTSTSKLDHIDGKFFDIPADLTAGYQVDNYTFTFKRV